MFSGWLYFRDRVLRDHATIVFDFNLQLVVRQDALAELKDLREPIRFQPMPGILSDVGLEQNRLALSRDAAAIDKVFHDMAHFGDMGVRRDKIAIRQDKTREGAGMFFNDGTQIG